MPRVNELIKQQLNDILIREIDFPDESFVTIVGVDTANDLSSCTVKVSILPADSAAKILKLLQGRKIWLQQELNKRITLRKVPKVDFVLDLSEKKAARIEELLDEISTTSQGGTETPPSKPSLP